jgi:hypothetical protein
LSKWGWMEEDILDWVGLLLGWIAGCGEVPLRGSKRGEGDHACVLCGTNENTACCRRCQSGRQRPCHGSRGWQGKAKAEGSTHSRGNHSSASVKKAHHHHYPLPPPLPAAVPSMTKPFERGGSSLLIGTTAHASSPSSRCQSLSQWNKQALMFPSLLPPIPLPFSLPARP